MGLMLFFCVEDFIRVKKITVKWGGGGVLHVSWLQANGKRKKVVEREVGCKMYLPPL